MAIENELDDQDEDILSDQEDESTDDDLADDAEGDQDDDQADEEETIVVKKSDYNKTRRKAIAYDEAKKSKDKPLPAKQETSVDPDRLERIELRQEGYSSEEVDEIMELGGRKVLKSKLVQGAIASMRKDKLRKTAEADSGTRSPVFKKYTREELNNMSSAELEKILPHD